MSSFTLPFFLIPAVSTKSNSKPNELNLVVSESLVVPAMLVTMFFSFPIRVFNKDDLPTLGLPTIAIFGTSLSSSSIGLSSICFTTSSNKSPVPLPLMAETLNISSPMANP